MKKVNKPINGAILLSKKAGLTSFQSLSLLKRKVGTRKVGHAGTLDKFAEGLLLVLVGSFTRLNSLTSDLDKEYLAFFQFGKTTPTLDPESPVSAVGHLPSLKEIEESLCSFRGTFSQVPPCYSAVHIAGKRAYERALKGEQFQIPARCVTIYDLEILDYKKGLLALRISCSKGTYIRSLARDLGFALETVSYVSQLRREKIGPFSLSSAVSEEFLEEGSFITAPVFLDSLGIAYKVVKDPLPFMRGQDLKVALDRQEIVCRDEGLLALLTEEEELLSLLRINEGCCSYVFSTS